MNLRWCTGSKSFIQKNVSYYLYENQRPSGGFIIVYDPLPNGKISNIKNSNPDVVKVELDEQFGAIRVNVLKEGTSKVSFRYAGKAFTQKITVVKYEDPCKSFKIGSTNYTKYFKNPDISIIIIGRKILQQL